MCRRTANSDSAVGSVGALLAMALVAVPVMASLTGVVAALRLALVAAAIAVVSVAVLLVLVQRLVNRRRLADWDVYVRQVRRAREQAALDTGQVLALPAAQQRPVNLDAMISQALRGEVDDGEVVGEDDQPVTPGPVADPVPGTRG